MTGLNLLLLVVQLPTVHGTVTVFMVSLILLLTVEPQETAFTDTVTKSPGYLHDVYMARRQMM